VITRKEASIKDIFQLTADNSKIVVRDPATYGRFQPVVDYFNQPKISGDRPTPSLFAFHNASYCHVSPESKNCSKEEQDKELAKFANAADWRWHMFGAWVRYELIKLRSNSNLTKALEATTYKDAAPYLSRTLLKGHELYTKIRDDHAFARTFHDNWFADQVADLLPPFLQEYSDRRRTDDYPNTLAIITTNKYKPDITLSITKDMITLTTSSPPTTVVYDPTSPGTAIELATHMAKTARFLLKAPRISVDIGKEPTMANKQQKAFLSAFLNLEMAKEQVATKQQRTTTAATATTATTATKYTISELKKKKVNELRDLAAQHGIEGYKKQTKAKLIETILAVQGAPTPKPKNPINDMLQLMTLLQLKKLAAAYGHNLRATNKADAIQELQRNVDGMRCKM